jgi:translocation and assembly module TamB
VPEHLLVDVRVEHLDAKLFDYQVLNKGPLRFAFDQQVIRATSVQLTGEGTELDVSGTIDLRDDRVALRATGDASLGLLQGFMRDVRSSGAAELLAEVRGTVAEPVFSGSASITNGRVRHFSLPHSLDAINGRVLLDATGLRMDDLTARLGGGLVRFGGRVGLKGYQPGELALTATGEGMRLRYPEGFRSVVDADLALRGDIAEPLLTGNVTVRSAVWTRRFDSGGLLGLGAVGAAAGAGTGGAIATGFPLRFDVRVSAPSALRVDNNIADIVSSADLTLRGTYDRPLLFGRADIERGWLTFEGNRYVVTRGSILFENPARIEPFFDFEAETRARVPGQTFLITLSAVGTPDRFTWGIASDPPLPQVDVLALLLGETVETGDAELRALRRGQQTEQELLMAGAARLLATPLGSPVGRAVEQTLGIDTVQITPFIGVTGELSTFQALNPGARVTIGKRISSRVYVTFSQALGGGHTEQIILVEYDQSDRLGWILSRNEDGTFALDFRVRHTF